MRYLILFLLSSLSYAGEYIQFQESLGKAIAVRVSAIQLVTRLRDELEISTGSQVVRIKVNSDTLSFADDLNPGIITYLAILSIVEGVEPLDTATSERLLSVVQDKTKKSTERSIAMKRLLADSTMITCVKVDVAKL